MFYESSVPSVKLEKTSNIIDMKYMFAGAKVQSVDLDDTSKVTTMQNMFSNAKLFNYLFNISASYWLIKIL